MQDVHIAEIFNTQFSMSPYSNPWPLLLYGPGQKRKRHKYIPGAGHQILIKTLNAIFADGIFLLTESKILSQLMNNADD